MPVWFACCVALAMGLAGTRPFDALDPPAPPHVRLPQLDGLRGLLALAVLFHHAAIYPSWLATGTWRSDAPFATMLGEGGVAVFFMITGFLFWSRLAARRGRQDWARLYLGRFFRIVPLYTVAMAAAVGVSVAATRQLNVPWPVLFSQVAQASAAGALPMPDVNRYNTGLMLAGVTWSLQYEWLFYLCLPALALLARARRQLLWLLFVAGVLVALLAAVGAEPKYACYAAEFGAGMVAASLPRRLAAFARGSTGAGVATLCLGIALGGFSSAEHLPAVFFLGVAFCLIANGATLFGLLVVRGLRRLGDISYGIYLLHGLVLALTFRPALLQPIALSGTIGVVGLTIAATLITVVVAALAHLAIERPGQKLGQRLGRWLQTRQSGVEVPPGLLQPARD